MDKAQLFHISIGVAMGLVYYTVAWETTNSHWVSAVAGILCGIVFYAVMRSLCIPLK